MGNVVEDLARAALARSGVESYPPWVLALAEEAVERCDQLVRSGVSFPMDSDTQAETGRSLFLSELADVTEVAPSATVVAAALKTPAVWRLRVNGGTLEQACAEAMASLAKELIRVLMGAAPTLRTGSHGDDLSLGRLAAA